MDVQKKLEALGWKLPEPPAPVASYLPAVRSGNLVQVSGQLPLDEGVCVTTGAVPDPTGIEEAKQAAARCAVNALAVLRREINGDWTRVVRVVRVGVFVQSIDGFTQQPAVANGASDLLAQVLGEAGRHARAAVGVNSLPLNATVEVEMTVEVRP
jgi:enamine deaminase RidA (YjgF/YER057c/UK114 family)